MTDRGKREGLFNNFSENERELFIKIKTVQSLPDEIVSEFFKCKGALSSEDSKIKFLVHEK